MLDYLHPSVFLVAAKSAPSKADVESLLKWSPIVVPDDYLELMSEVCDPEFSMGRGRVVRIWGPKRIVEMNIAYEIQKWIPNSLGIGDDEMGGALILMSGANGFGLYKSDFGDLDADDAKFLSPSIRVLLIEIEYAHKRRT